MSLRIALILISSLVFCFASEVRAFAGLITLTNNTAFSVDNASQNVVFNVNNATPGFTPGDAISAITISITFQKASGGGITGFPSFNEIAFSLSGPSAGPITLVPSGHFNTPPENLLTPSFNGTIVFNDTNAFPVLPNSIAAGTFRPFGSFATLATGSPLGNFTLTVQDTGLSGGSLNFISSTLTITTVPEPSGLLLVGITGVCLALASRSKLRRKKESHLP